MNSRAKSAIREKFWILKIVSALLALVLTIRFAVPVSSVIAENTVSLLTDFENSENILMGQVSFEETAEETTAAEYTEIETEPETEEPSTEEALSEAVTETERIYETPDDIVSLENEYLAAFADTSPYGSVEEVFFKTSGATDIVDGISVKNATATKKPDFAALIKEGPVLDIKDKSEPVVLIFHTHTTESYLLSDNGVFYEDYKTRSTDISRNMVRVGDEICRVLEENGIGYIHDKNIYDESYDGAYSRSRVTVEKYLEEYPTIQIVLDVHRDAIYYSDTSHCKPTAEIGGRKAAQIMIITGAEEGYITDFPYWEDNLRFALCFQKTAEEKYPGLMKPLYFCQRKYNMDTAKCSLLLEMGTDANTLDEAMYSGYLTGKVLTEIINRHCGE
ncbi:MAG: stage II sporulation protein P [Clostridia bacterium]|nr:stage II sporulation protein P [Clostridia bacterium]